nr:unnamed protein product [Callosobruchus analis]
MSIGLDVLSGSLRVRNSTCIGAGPYKNYNCKISEVKSCPSVMSPETKRLLPPNTETVQTKPFPIRAVRFILKFPIPSNCLTLQPPKLNEEVRSVIATQTQKNDRYMLHLQEQMGASLSAIGSILNLKLLDPNVPLTLDDTKLQILAEAAQLLANSFHAVSVKRRFDIQPFLSQESRDASYKCPIDEFLFGSGFLEQLKACQNVRKVAEEIKKPEPSFSRPSTSLGPRDLNSNRPFYKTKKKRSPSPTFERRLKMFHRKDHQRNRENQDHRQAQKFRKWRTKK